MKILEKIFKRNLILAYLNKLQSKISSVKCIKIDQKCINFYSQFITKDSLVFGVGTNIGNRVKIFLKLGANVVAIEPQEECIKVLQSSFGNILYVLIKL